MCYATDASVYRELPLAVAWPKGVADLRRLLAFARQHGVPLIPRAAGTSLAGQVVGGGIVVDVGVHMNRILEIDAANRRVRVEPGVVRVLHDAFKAALMDPAHAEVLARYDMPVIYKNSADYTAYVGQVMEEEGTMIRRLNLRIN